MKCTKLWLLMTVIILSSCNDQSWSSNVTPNLAVSPDLASAPNLVENAEPEVVSNPVISEPVETPAPTVEPVVIVPAPVVNPNPVVVPDVSPKPDPVIEPPPVTQLTGLFLDSPIINVTYSTESLSGVTNSLGEYNYLPGETVTFSIGDLRLPTVNAAEVVTPLNLFDTTDAADTRVVNTVRLLQTIDQDGNPENGITISETAKGTATQVDFELAEESFSASGAVTNLIFNAGQNAVVTGLVSKTEALAHFERELTNRGMEFTAFVKQVVITQQFTTVSGPVQIINENGYVLENIRISNPNGDCIQVKGSQNIVIKNSWIGPCKGEGILVEDSRSVEVTQNYFESVRTGIYARNSSQAINIQHNEFKNMLGPFPRGQIVQLNGIDGGGSRINYNYVINLPDQSYPEDAINLYNSDGLANDKIEIIGNFIKGGGPSLTGGGIMTGDKSGSYVIVSDNVLINPGQYGIAVASGHHIDIVDNKVYSGQQYFSNVGAYIWNQYDAKCYSNTFIGNKVFWISKSGSANHWWEASTGKRAGGRCTNTTKRFNNWGSSDVSDSMSAPDGAGITAWNGPLTSN